MRSLGVGGDRRQRPRQQRISGDTHQVGNRHRAVGRAIAAQRQQKPEPLRRDHEADRSPQARARIRVSCGALHRFDGGRVQQRHHGAGERRGEDQHDPDLQRRPREGQPAERKEHPGRADRERPGWGAEPVGDPTPDQCGRRGDGLLREGHRSDLLAGEAQAAQIGREEGKERPDAGVIEEVEPAQPRDHPGASSGSIVHSSGNAAFSASAIVCWTLVSAISKV